MDSDEIMNTEPLDKQLAEVQNLIDELEAWHSRTGTTLIRAKISSTSCVSSRLSISELVLSLFLLK